MAGSEKHHEHNPVLGIAFGHDQIRAVEVRREGSSFSVSAAGSAQIPAGALDPGSTIPHDIIAQRLKTLLRKMGASSRHAVFGIPSSGVFTRLLDIPHVPDDELDAVVSGEVAHYQMVRSDGGAFAYSKIASSEGSREMPVVVMASDDPILVALDDIAKGAGLAVVSREPQQLGSIRASMPKNVEKTLLIISIEDVASEIAIVDQGRMSLYRRIDVGGLHLVANALAAQMIGSGGVDYVPAAFSPSEPLPIDEVLSSRLATEIRRSLDFYRRQFPESEVTQAVLAPADPRLATMTEYLGNSLGVQCTLAEPTVGASPGAYAEMGTPPSTSYLGAIGIAIGENGYGADTLPRFDLVPAKPHGARLSEGGSKVAASLVATLVVAGAGLGYWWTVKSDAEETEKRVVSLETENRRLTEILKPKEERRQQELKVIADLARQGVPFPWVMDEVTTALDPGVGVNEISFDGGRVRVSGEARTEAAMISTLDRLRTQGSFRSTYLNQFQNPDGLGLRFDLSSTFVIPEPVRLIEPVVGDTSPRAPVTGGTP